MSNKIVVKRERCVTQWPPPKIWQLLPHHQPKTSASTELPPLHPHRRHAYGTRPHFQTHTSSPCGDCPGENNPQCFLILFSELFAIQQPQQGLVAKPEETAGVRNPNKVRRRWRSIRNWRISVLRRRFEVWAPGSCWVRRQVVRPVPFDRSCGSITC